MNQHGGARKGSGRKTKTGRKSITIYIKKEIIRTLEPGARTKLRQWIENTFTTARYDTRILYDSRHPGWRHCRSCGLRRGSPDYSEAFRLACFLGNRRFPHCHLYPVDNLGWAPEKSLSAQRRVQAGEG